jgi:hypothetical protein
MANFKFIPGAVSLLLLPVLKEFAQPEKPI